MYSWYLICYRSRLHAKVIDEIERIGVECYMPMKTRLTLRADRKNSFRTHTTPLFPGYLFVRFSPEITHTTLIAKQSSVQGFVRLGREICTVSQNIIDAIRCLSFRLENKDEKLSYIECKNVSPGMLKEIEKIIKVEKPEVRTQTLLQYLSYSIQHPTALLASG
ncbi:transcription termination/antitermination NusG family protein [Serratia liquefaciens]|uniref:transcription termination/antitermination NusG family protein n=1 Tax=Serratia liquefaciens TaxID=614 RepID=UPI0022B9CC1F|nr:transcription termination/antitermination NusG family protein [Serratia liquefaciens]